MTDDFDLSKYKLYIRSKLKNKVKYRSTDVTEQLLEALEQFRVPPSKYITFMSQASISQKYCLMFDLSQKFDAIPLNRWFLLQFGFNYCNTCNEIKNLSYFGKDNRKSNKTQNKCKRCCVNKNKKWQLNNVDKLKQYKKEYRLANLPKYAALEAKRRANKIAATPKWLSIAQTTEIQSYYITATLLTNNTGIKYEVDHIVPLRGKNVCGLHVPWNLQVISAEDNRRKYNKF